MKLIRLDAPGKSFEASVKKDRMPGVNPLKRQFKTEMRRPSLPSEMQLSGVAGTNSGLWINQTAEKPKKQLHRKKDDLVRRSSVHPPVASHSGYPPPTQQTHHTMHKNHTMHCWTDYAERKTVSERLFSGARGIPCVPGHSSFGVNCLMLAVRAQRLSGYTRHPCIKPKAYSYTVTTGLPFAPGRHPLSQT